MASLNRIRVWNGTAWVLSGLIAHTNLGIWTIYKVKYWNGSAWI